MIRKYYIVIKIILQNGRLIMPSDNFFLIKTTVVFQESRNSNVISLSGSFILEIVFFT